MACFRVSPSMAILEIVVFYYLIHGVTSTCPDTSPKIFLSQPEDVTVKEGSNVTFTCVVSNFDQDTDRITWFIDPEFPAFYESEFSESFKERNREMTSTLTIHNVRKQKHTLQCVLYVMDSQNGVRMCHSTVGTLLVKKFPETDDLHCGPKGPLIFNESELAEIWCKLSSWSPGIVLGLYLDNATLLSSTETGDKDKQVLRKTTKMMQDFHDTTLTCSVTNPSFFPGQYISCIIGPFRVLKRMHLDITSQYMSTSDRITEKQDNFRKTTEMTKVTEAVSSTNKMENNHLSQTSDYSQYRYTAESRNSQWGKDSSAKPSTAEDYSATSQKDEFEEFGMSEIRKNFPSKLGQNFIGIIAGASLATVVLVACLFVAVIMVLHRHLQQPRGNMALNDLHELQKLASMLEEKTKKQYTSSMSSVNLEVKEPDYAEPQFVMSSQRPLALASDEDTASSNSYTRITNSDYSEYSRINSFITSSSGSSESVYSDVTDNSRYEKDAKSHKGCSNDFSTNSVYGNQNVVDTHLTKSLARKGLQVCHNGRRGMVDSTDFPAPPPISVSSK